VGCLLSSQFISSLLQPPYECCSGAVKYLSWPFPNDCIGLCWFTLTAAPFMRHVWLNVPHWCRGKHTIDFCYCLKTNLYLWDELQQPLWTVHFRYVTIWQAGIKRNVFTLKTQNITDTELRQQTSWKQFSQVYSDFSLPVTWGSPLKSLPISSHRC